MPDNKASQPLNAMASAEVPPALVFPDLSKIAGEEFYNFTKILGQKHISTKLKRGGTLAVVLDNAGINRVEAANAISAMSKVFNPRNFRAGQKLDLILEPIAETGRLQLAGLSTRTSVDRTLVLNRRSNGDFIARELLRETELKLIRVQGEITSSLYLSALNAGASDAAVIEFSRLYAYSVDFQRGIRAGDSFDMVFESYVDEKGNTVKTGNLLYARLMPRKRDLKLYRYQTPDGEAGYYNEKGESARRFLMKTPIDGARISSSFGQRKHPVLGYVRNHPGTDFAAGTGTPIFAAGNGVIERSNRFGSYGNYIRIRHSNGFKTAYAHLSKFGRGVKKGRRVQQGQIIGYVGATGRVTGPHLHYEVYKNGKRVNPMTVKLPSGRKLKKSELPAFSTTVKEIDSLIEKTLPVNIIAQNNMETSDKEI
ncbi:MAG: peptidoglycan DD-metalloendopeptidase family protein [Robiginitomaculum sp.]|nr:peptidoglycan DD-metalloendopeptidase family protein [Robiginitomaculum sp.]